MTFWCICMFLYLSCSLAFHPPINLLTLHLLEIIDAPSWQYYAVWLTELLLYGPSHLPQHWCHLAKSFTHKDATQSCKQLRQHQTAPVVFLMVSRQKHTHAHTQTHFYAAKDARTCLHNLSSHLWLSCFWQWGQYRGYSGSLRKNRKVKATNTSVPTLQKPPHYPFSGEGRKHT